MPSLPDDYLADGRRELILDECSYSRFAFRDNFAELELLHQTVEDLILREEAAEVGRLAQEAEKLSGGGSGEFWAENHPYWWDHIIAPQFRTATFVAIMAALELHLVRLADDAGVVVRAPIGQHDLKGGVYDRTRKFLILFCGIKQPPERAWQRVCDFYAVRNAVVHNGGFAGKQEKRIATFAASVDGLGIENGHVTIRRDFCEAALHECRGFLEGIWESLAAICRAAR